MADDGSGPCGLPALGTASGKERPACHMAALRRRPTTWTTGTSPFPFTGLLATLDCHVPRLQGRLDWLLGEFRNPDVSAGGRQVKSNYVAGSIAPFDLELATQRAPSVLAAGHRGDELVTLFQDGEHFWMLDERWGLCQVDLLRAPGGAGCCRGHASTRCDAAELAALWPLAQLLRGRGVHLVPAASIARGNWARCYCAPTRSNVN